MEAEEDKKKDEAVETSKQIAVAGGLVAAAALLGWGISKVMKKKDEEAVSNGVERKMMKAPGRGNSYIYRDEFEENPSSYFRDLRK